ncbi:hypothetical protein EXIGLDRAFT_724231 [Exidia glandulosa HHB12029]|uniref:Uncharacterized protein n=1 Tax=Exidia glandulosa HHB12029 TaxID=1314781 RepID=A0A165EHK3_EXIGL|nr:hypothetical protein EXIGLDRAFT_724231 [Exidia glandulosa HHB12029]
MAHADHADQHKGVFNRAGPTGRSSVVVFSRLQYIALHTCATVNVLKFPGSVVLEVRGS